MKDTMASIDASSSNEDSLKKYKTVSFMVVNNVLQLEADKAEILSPTFTCAEDPFCTTFKIKFGFGTEEEGKLAVWIVPMNSDVKLFKLRLRIYDDQMNARDEFEGTFSFGVKKVGSNWGWANKLTLGEVGALRFVFDVTYEAVASQYIAVGEKTGDSTSPEEKALPKNLSAFSRNLLALLDNPDDTDVTVCIGDEEIKCHKVVLVARSAYFRGLFESGMKESQTNTVTMSETSPALFRHVLKFLYSAQLPDNLTEIAFDLLPFAEKYLFEELKAACEDAIRDAVTTDNVIQAIVLADKHHCPNLFRHCVPIFKRYINDLQKKEEWDSLVEPDLLRRLLLSCCNDPQHAADKTSATNCDKPVECPQLGHAIQLSTDFGKMYGDKAMAEGGYADVVFKLENEEKILVHMPIMLATPSRLRNQLIKLMKNATAKVKHVAMAGPPSLIKEVIKFLYCGMPPENLDSIAMELLPVALKYGVTQLRVMCGDALRRILTVENLVDILILSDVNDCPGLFKFCLPFYKANLSRLDAQAEEKLINYPRLLMKLTKGCFE